jgi:hypothetical protein
LEQDAVESTVLHAALSEGVVDLASEGEDLDVEAVGQKQAVVVPA